MDRGAWGATVHGATKSRALLLLLSRFSRVRLCATPQMAAHQALPSLGFSRKEHWSVLPLPSPLDIIHPHLLMDIYILSVSQLL